MKLLVAEGERVLRDCHVVSRLGEGMRDGRLAEEAVQRTVEALEGFAAVCRELGVRRCRAVGTSALRDAANRDRLLSASPFPIEVISGEEEARLSYLGASRFGGTGEPARTVLDLGGGSTEIITGPHERASYPLGAARLTNGWLPSDPATKEEVRSALEAARAALKDAPTTCPPPVVLVGSTGLNLAGLAEAEGRGLTEPGLDPWTVEGHRLTLEQVRRQRERVSRLSVAQRQRLPGLEPDRAPAILGAALAAEALLERLGLQEVTVSGKGLRYGVLAEMLQRS